jgi:ABC-type sugar transport system ATPase subunit
MIEARRLTIQVGTFVLREASFRVPTGTYAVLMGKTGSGKTTLLEAICGLKQIVAGQVILAGHDVTQLKPAQRDIGFVPQDGALFPTMTVAEHLEFALAVRRWPTDARRRRLGELARLLHLEELLLRYPHQLSGGERQRVALGRALSFRPHTLCLDEPLSALDDDTRREMIGYLKRVQRETKVTALHVTHNRHEAEELGDVLLRIDAGCVHLAGGDAKGNGDLSGLPGDPSPEERAVK